jgi:excisionase family DNA binding protein
MADKDRAEHATETVSETISIDEFAAMLGVSRNTVYNMRKDKSRNFPTPVPLGLRHLRFRRDEAEAFSKFGSQWRSRLSVMDLR